MLRKIWKLYYDGFRTMPAWGRTLWAIIIIKLCIMFLVFRLFLMPDFLSENFGTQEERSDYVFEELTTQH